MFLKIRTKSRNNHWPRLCTSGTTRIASSGQALLQTKIHRYWRNL